MEEGHFSTEQQQWLQTQIAQQLGTCLERFSKEIKELADDYAQSAQETGYATTPGR